MESPLLVSDLAVVLVAAGACAFLFHRLGQPLVLGYICAGLLVGPHLFEPGLIRDPNSVETLGNLGVIFLLFALGLDFTLSRLRRVGLGALIVGLVEIPLMLLAGYHLGGLMGRSPTDRLFLGAVVAISGTTIIVKILKDLGRANHPSARLIFGVLVVEDILAVLILAALSAMATTGSADVGGLAVTALGVALFLVLTAVVGSLLVPRLLRVLADRGRPEMLLIAIMGVLFAVALIALQLGYSVALGAFIAGAVVGETRQVRDVERLTTPMKDLFGAVFFVSVGLRIDPAALVDLWAPILAVTGLVISGKVACCSFGTFVAGYGPRTALGTGMGLAQIGEFSFIIAQSGIALGVVTEDLYALTAGVSALTIFASPYLIRASDRLVDRFEERAPAPLVTYLELYGRWVRKLRLPGSVRLILGLVWKPLLQTMLNLVAAVALLSSAGWVSAGLGGEESPGRGAAILTFVSLLAMPFVIASWRKTRAICLILAEAALAGRSLPEPRALALRNLLAFTGTLLAAVIAAAWILAASAASLPPLPILVVAAAVITALSAALYRWMVRFQATLQAAFLRLAERRDEGEEILVQPMDLVRRYYPYGVSSAEISVPPGASVVGNTLRSLELRTRTGATVLAIDRHGEGVTDLADTPLAPGDSLLILGEASQIAEARRIVTATSAGNGAGGRLAG